MPMLSSMLAFTFDEDLLGQPLLLPCLLFVALLADSHRLCAMQGTTGTFGSEEYLPRDQLLLAGPTRHVHVRKCD